MLGPNKQYQTNGTICWIISSTTLRVLMFDTRPSGFDQTNKMTRICRCAGRTETFIELPGHSPLLVVARGTSEQPELQRRPRDYHAARKAVGLPAKPLVHEGRDQSSILEEFASLTGELTNAVVQLAKLRLPME
jgi:hypothetical protein